MCNFKPSIFKSLSNINIKKNKFNKQIYCKNFFIYLLLLKNKTRLFKNTSIFIKKFKKKVYTILKAPYRYKIARHQISINRYNINFSLRVELIKKIKLNNWSQILNLFNFLKSFQKIFESNTISINSLKFDVPLNYSNNFKISQFSENTKNK